eukprot:9538956-Alexandrium_andersonii.AAC.1
MFFWPWLESLQQGNTEASGGLQNGNVASIVSKPTRAHRHFVMGELRPYVVTALRRDGFHVTRSAFERAWASSLDLVTLAVNNFKCEHEPCPGIDWVAAAAYCLAYSSFVGTRFA